MIPVMVVPVLHYYEKLQTMLDTVDHPIGHAIVIDNGGQCPDLYCDWIDRITILRMPSNLGVPTSWNLGIQLEPWAPYWLMSQDDITWIPGGLARIEEQSGPDILTMDMAGPRPFSSYTVGAQVVQQVGLFDESYYPIGGDDLNYHKRCHWAEIEERDISGTFVAEQSATIQHLVTSRTGSPAVIILNMERALRTSVACEGWTLTRRRRNGRTNTTTEISERLLHMLASDYRVHNPTEEQWMRVTRPTS